MRSIIFGFLISLLVPASAFADDMTFRQQLYRFLKENSWVLPEELKSKASKVGIVLSIDRDGRLLSADVDQSSGSPEYDATALAGVRHMKSFPRVPDELPVPYQIKTTFNFGVQDRVGYVDLKWPPMSTATSGQEIAFQSDLLHHLRAFPRVLSEGTKKLNDIHSKVEFSIDRDGKLIDVKITRSSAPKAVDDGTLAWLKSIPPFPKIPSEVKAPMKLTAEIVFGPKGNDDEAKRKVSGVCRGC
jgi:TonB family protein